MMTISLCLLSPCYLNPSLSCLLTLPSSPPSPPLTHSPNFSYPLYAPALSGSMCPTSVYLRSCQAKKSRTVNVKNCPTDFYQVWLSLQRDEMWAVRLPLCSCTPRRPFTSIFFKLSLQHCLFIYLALSFFSLSSLFASQAVWHLAPSLWRGTVGADNYTSCPVSAL